MTQTKIQQLDFQLKRADEITTKLHLESKPSVLITDNVGFGKTYSIAFALQKLRDSGFFSGSHRLWPAVWVTKATVVEQTKRVLKEFKLSKIVNLVTNYDQFRSSFGEQFITMKTEVVKGVETFRFHWSPFVIPRLIILDECQGLKNASATQTTIFQDLIDYLPTQDYQTRGIGPCSFIFSSASPFTRVSEAKVWATSTRHKMKFGWVEVPLDSKHWPSFAQDICGRTSPEDYNKEACGRLMEELKDYRVCTKYQEIQSSFAKLGRKLYRALNSTILVDFRSPADAMQYHLAYEEYLRELAKIGKNEPQGIAKIWVAIGKFRKKAELLRAEILAESMWTTVSQGKSAVCAVNFKGTISKAVKYLVETKGVSRDNISIIWGGVEDIAEAYDYLDLGPQSHKKRQAEIDKFQRDESHYCFFTFKAGGVGLSLHHAEPSMRQRESYIAPTYSAIELVQGTGRAPRITSWSDTSQLMVFFRGTIEEQVAAKVAMKMKCLKEVVAARETWADALMPKEEIERFRETLESTRLEEDEDELDGVAIIEDGDVETETRALVTT